MLFEEHRNLGAPFVIHLLSVDFLYACKYNILRYQEVDFKMDIVKVFGKNVRKYRTKLGISQEKFAELAGLHRTYISGIERFQRSISLENIQKIADALQIETYQLFIDG